MSTAAVSTAIREATLEDLQPLVLMSGRFLQQSEYGDFILDNPVRREQTFRGLLATKDAVVLVIDRGGELVGFLALVAHDHIISGVRCVAELAWWVEPDARGRAGLELLKWGEQWARCQGAKVMQMVAPNEEVERLYLRMGYQPVERQFQRELS